MPKDYIHGCTRGLSMKFPIFVKYEHTDEPVLVQHPNQLLNGRLFKVLEVRADGDDK
jgi:hypothetical protein